MELRWFGKGKLPAPLEHWFFLLGENDLVENEQGRSDYYHHLTANGKLGTKLREGSVQIKELVAKRKVLRLPGMGQGRIEHWQKWSFDVAGAEGEMETIKQMPGRWIKVGKNRWKQFFRREQGKLLQVPPGIQAVDGCQLELALITCNSQDWWTVSFESIGPDEALMPNLTKTVGHVFKDQEIGPYLDLEGSYGYPQWLDVVEKGI